jgi:Flp pilus assembly protein TadB
MEAWILLSIAFGLAITGMFWSLTVNIDEIARALDYRQKALMRHGIQVRLDEAQLDISAREFVKQSALLGGGLAAGLYAFVGAVTLIPVGVVAGVLLTWTQLETKRDRRMVKYHQQLASACDTLRNAYLTSGSLSNAMVAVTEYGASPVKEDFELALTAARQGELMAGLQTIANRRRSIVFDAIANALLRAEESSGAVSEMLQRLSESTRQNVAAFETAMIQQINSRSNVNWGAFGPWVVFAVAKVSLGGSMGGAALGGQDFFATPVGNMIALAAGTLTIALHRWCFRIAQRDMTIQRIETSDPGSQRAGRDARAMPTFAIGELQPAIRSRVRQRPLGESNV